MRVVYVSTIERGGPLTHLRQLAPRVAAEGVEVEVLCGSEELAESFRGLDVPAHTVEVSHKLDVRGARRLLPFMSWRRSPSGGTWSSPARRTTARRNSATSS